MITFNNLSLYYATERWLMLQQKYIETNDASYLRQQRQAERRMADIVRQIKEELSVERLRVDPLA